MGQEVGEKRVKRTKSNLTQFKKDQQRGRNRVVRINMIKLRCLSCNYHYEVSEAELKDNADIHSYCLMCGGVIEVVNWEEVVEKDLDDRVNEYLDKWFHELGIEGTIELLERNKDIPTTRLYLDELRKRGLIK